MVMTNDNEQKRIIKDIDELYDTTARHNAFSSVSKAVKPSEIIADYVLSEISKAEKRARKETAMLIQETRLDYNKPSTMSGQYGMQLARKEYHGKCEQIITANKEEL
jgi:hypothetical protein